MAKASLLLQAVTLTHQNLSSFTQERISGEMSEITKKNSKSDNSSSQMQLLGGTSHMQYACTHTL